MASRAEMRSNDSVNLEESLGVLAGLEPAHAPLPFSGRLVRVLGAVVEVPMLSMSNTRHHNPFRRPVAAQLVRNKDTRFASSHAQQLAEEANGGEPIPLGLHKDIEDNAVLIHRSPEVVSDAVDLQENFIQMPFITSSSTSSPEAIGIFLTEFVAPAPDRFVANHHTTCGHHLFYIPKAHAEPEVQPDAFRDDLFRESMPTVQVVRHSFSIASQILGST